MTPTNTDELVQRVRDELMLCEWFGRWGGQRWETIWERSGAKAHYGYEVDMSIAALDVLFRHLSGEHV